MIMMQRNKKKNETIILYRVFMCTISSVIIVYIQYNTNKEKQRFI